MVNKDYQKLNHWRRELHVGLCAATSPMTGLNSKGIATGRHSERRCSDSPYSDIDISCLR